MNEATGFPVPTLPAPGSAPVVPMASAPTSPTAFAMPADAAVDLPAPSATNPLTAPSLPDATAPALPPTGGAAPLASPSAAAGAVDSPVIVAEDPSDAPGKTKKFGVGKFLPVMLVLGAGALGYVGFTNMSDDSSQGTAEPAPVTVAPVASSPLLVPINDAKALVDEINENAAEQEALGELGRGAPPAIEAPRVEIADLTVGAAVELHAGDLIKDDLIAVLGAPTFKYGVQRGEAIEQAIWVDSASGNRELFDGTTYVRIVDGVVYSTTDPSGSWIIDPAAAPTEPLIGLTDMVTIDRVLPEELLNELTATTAGDESASGSYLFVDTELAAATPEARSAWLTAWGFDGAIAPTAVAEFVGGVPDSAAPGMILVSIVSNADGVVTSLTIEAPALGETVSYRLEGASMESLAIEVPATTG